MSTWRVAETVGRIRTPVLGWLPVNGESRMGYALHSPFELFHACRVAPKYGPAFSLSCERVVLAPILNVPAERVSTEGRRRGGL
jgi:hypothetical protein